MDPPPQPQPLSQKSTGKDVRDCPQTPLGRLPLSELLACGEDNRQHLNFTPIERVLWENSPIKSDPPSSMPNRKRRKRAHSSSPASSSQNEASKHFAKEKQAANLQALQKALKTPKADPADDLWSRYSLNTNAMERLSPTAPAGMEFAHLMNSSSPQTPASHIQRDSGGLRRALSCIEWPTSAAKRRKLFHGSSQRHSTTFGTVATGQSAERTRMSRVSMLVEKVHDGLLRPTRPRETDSSSEPGRSSPIGDQEEFSSSPTNDDALLNQTSQKMVEGVTEVLSQTAVAPQSDVPKPLILSDDEIANLGQIDSSDFDDDDLDKEIMENIDATVQKQITISGQGDLPGPGNNESDTHVVAEVKNEVHGQSDPQLDGQKSSRESEGYSDVSFPTGTPLTTIKEARNQDEFCDDDDDNDMFAADLEDVCAKYDSQAQPDKTQDQTLHTSAKSNHMRSENPAMPQQLANPALIEVLSDDDDFGDDLDFEQVAAECAEVTQREEVAQPQSSVCLENFGSYI